MQREPCSKNESSNTSEPQIPNEKHMNEEIIIKLTKDLKATASSMTINEARFLVDSYYQMQDNRKRAAGQIRSVKDEPHAVLEWLENNASYLENQIKAALACFAESQHMGKWAMSVHGIGPVIAAGLLAHIDITKAPTVGHIWRFAGFDPTSKWEKGQKRPHNAKLKQVCFFIGECFIKVKASDKDYYGKLYDQRKAYESAKNEAGEYAEQAAAILKSRPTHAQKAIYKEGKLPPGQLHARARRYMVKQFLSDWHAESYRNHFKTEPPLPYPIAILGHAHHRKAA